MARDSIPVNKIALLATGDEISNGDILNTNTQELARQLFDHGMHVGMHLVTADTIADIEDAILFLLKSHSALIITGGLGPTSDDLTRFALSKAVNQPLIFDEHSWNDIVQRLKRFGYDTPPSSNRQQALFPETATIIPNPHGTAAGCMFEYQQQLIFMLPGPPAECLPMFELNVLPKLKNSGFSQVEYHKNWLLFGVSEGQIAEELDALAKPYDCVTGYRLFYPYIEFKLHSNHHGDFLRLVPKVEALIKPYLIDDGRKIASELLREQLEKLNVTLTICDLATGGLLETIIKTPHTISRLHFTYDINEPSHIMIKGLEAFWQNEGGTQTRLEIHVNFTTPPPETIDVIIPFRGPRVKSYAVEFICWKVFELLSQKFTRNEIEKH